MKMETAYSVPAVNPAYERRLRQTIELINKQGKLDHASVLVIGEETFFEPMLEEHYKKKFDYTDFDLNYESPAFIKNDYDVILCFQVIEHILNPLLMLEEIKKYMHEDSKLYITYPTHGTYWFWSSGHFNEYDKSRFDYLLKIAGLKTIDYFKRFMWSKSILGFRPLLRFTPIGWCIHHYYCLRKK